MNKAFDQPIAFTKLKIFHAIEDFLRNWNHEETLTIKDMNSFCGKVTADFQPSVNKWVNDVRESIRLYTKLSFTLDNLPEEELRNYCDKSMLYNLSNLQSRLYSKSLHFRSQPKYKPFNHQFFEDLTLAITKFCSKEFSELLLSHFSETCIKQWERKLNLKHKAYNFSSGILSTKAENLLKLGPSFQPSLNTGSVSLPTIRLLNEFRTKIHKKNKILVHTLED